MRETRLFSHNQAERFYDRLGGGLDSQAFYESPALEQLAENLDLKACRGVIEFGCGTGRFAAQLFEQWLPPQASYLGLDISRTMVNLSGSRLTQYGERAEVRQSDGSICIGCPVGAYDRFVCTYVLDLLSEDEIRELLAEAHRVLEADGLLGVVGSTNGTTPASRLVTSIWRGLHWLSPWLVGGCRPIEDPPRIARFRLEYHLPEHYQFIWHFVRDHRGTKTFYQRDRPS
jgi:ubiquinone/menaquinone biosynthesis C-methylase UbiE